MKEHSVKVIDFFSLSPYVRYVQENHGGDDHKVPPRIIYDFEIIFIISGTCNFVIEEAEYALGKGDILLIRPYLENSSYVSKGNMFHYFAVHFDPVYMGESMDFSGEEVYVKLDYIHMDYIPIDEELTDRPIIEISEVEFPHVIHARNPEKYIELFRELLLAFQSKSYGYHLTMRAWLLLIIKLMVGDVAIQDGAGKEQQFSGKISQWIRHMYDHYDEEIDIDKIAQAMLVSPNYLRKLFKAATGKTPHEFLMHIRMDRAKEFLLEEQYTISEICTMVGYQDLHNFSKMFKKIEGLSPKNYLKSLTI